MTSSPGVVTSRVDVLEIAKKSTICALLMNLAATEAEAIH